MDPSYKHPASPGTPLFHVSPERVNQQRSQYNLQESPLGDSLGESYSHDTSVHDKVAAFNSLAYQSKQLERKANDAALKRAMLGREEAESEMRRYRDEARTLRRHVEEGKDRERKVGERLESVMENYGRIKETHAHTQTLWEKEIRRARKEAFKSQSVIVKLQEELKAARNSLRLLQTDLEQEKDRSVMREQEAFAARYQLVGVQEELAHVQEMVKLVEQERDALRTIAKNEEIARIAAEGHIPLPVLPQDDEFASPKKERKSLSAVTITSSAASEEELDEIRTRLNWEQHRANRAHDRLEFLEMECRLKCCESRASRATEKRSPMPVALSKPEDICKASPQAAKIGLSSVVFVPAEGVFRTVSPTPEESPWISPAKKSVNQKVDELSPQRDEIRNEIPSQERTPSCSPPAPALASVANTSLLSLLEAPQRTSQDDQIPEKEDKESQNREIQTQDNQSQNDQGREKEADENRTQEIEDQGDQGKDEQLHGSSTIIERISTVSTTIRIPLADVPDLTPPLDLSNPALSPTMSREEALAQIRARRGRARSFAQGLLTPKKQMVEGGGVRRDISAPAIRSANIPGKSLPRV